MTDLFKTIYFGHTARWEGGYVDHAHDPGGATNWGITINTLAKWWASQGRNAMPTRVDVQALTKAEAEAIMRDWYWRPCQCDVLPAIFAALVFDTAVNSGPARAIKTLQKALNGGAGHSLKVDGAIGPRTLSAASRTLRHKQGRKVALEYLARRMVFYGGLQIFRRFGLGWARRLFALAMLCVEINGMDGRGGQAALKQV